jgi:hypothetical protein
MVISCYPDAEMLTPGELGGSRDFCIAEGGADDLSQTRLVVGAFSISVGLKMYRSEL